MRAETRKLRIRLVATGSTHDVVACASGAQFVSMIEVPFLALETWIFTFVFDHAAFRLFLLVSVEYVFAGGLAFKRPPCRLMKRWVSTVSYLIMWSSIVRIGLITPPTQHIVPHDCF